MNRDSSQFPVTQWSLILSAKSDNASKVRLVLGELCQIYWYPLYAFIRRRGHDEQQALDLTQDFFVHFLTPGFVSRADPERGRFRGFLFTSLRNFLGRVQERSGAQKRGGGICPISLDGETAAERYRLEPIEPGLTPEEAFERAWALNVIEGALKELKGEYLASKQAIPFDRLREIVWGDDDFKQQSVAEEFMVSVSSVKVALHRFRKRLRERLCAAVARTVTRHDEAADELNVLLSALRPHRSGAVR